MYRFQHITCKLFAAITQAYMLFESHVRMVNTRVHITVFVYADASRVLIASSNRHLTMQDMHAKSSELQQYLQSPQGAHVLHIARA